MNKYGAIIRKAAEEYGITKGDSESMEQWKTRVIYSIIGRLAYSSLGDYSEEGHISVVHFKRKIMNAYGAYKTMYPELSYFLIYEPSELADEIYNLFLKCGVLYHRSNHLVVSTQSVGFKNGVVFTRGFNFDERQFVSGLGTYIFSDRTESSVEDMFQLDTRSLNDIWCELTENAKWDELKYEGAPQFHRMDKWFNKGFWVNVPDKSGRVSLMKLGLPGNDLYYLYYYKNHQLYGSQLPQWRVVNHEYRTITCSILLHYDLLPNITYTVDRDIVYMDFNYLPSPMEHSLIKLYSWPRGNIQSNFKRVVSKQAFDVVRTILEGRGFRFTEGKL